MKFMIEFRVKPGQKEKMIATFEKVGPNRNSGVALRGAWIGSRSDVIFALVESDDEARAAAAAQAYSAHADATLHAVNDIEQF
jgi:hypothetical protein